MKGYRQLEHESHARFAPADFEPTVSQLWSFIYHLPVIHL